MKVCIDIQPAITQRAGVGRYTKHLVQSLNRFKGGDNLVLFYFDFKRKALHFDVPRAVRRPWRGCPGRVVQGAWKHWRWPPFDWLAGAADVYHFPNFIVPPLRRGRAVVTIHDLSFIRFPQFAEERNRQYLSARLRDTIARADAILTVSRFTAREVQAEFGVDPSRTVPIHLGVEEGLARPAPDAVGEALGRLGLRRPYLLTVGTLEPRKNIPFLVQLFERLTDFDGDLVIAGMPGWKYEPILDRMRGSTRADRIRYLQYVDEAALPSLYAGAALFLFPSFYEGFGLPPLEAMACGTPVVSSSAGSLREVLGSAAVLLDTFDADCWLAETRRALADAPWRESLAAAGRKQAAAYSWDECARRTWDVYRKVAA
jgi:glycosyltransferase involved in cell wall biosynthesis